MREKFFMFFATGRREKAAEKEIDGTGVNFRWGQFEVFEGGRLEQAL